MDLRIGICDDKPEWLEKAGDTVKRCAEQMQKKVEMYFFQNGSEPEMAGMPDYLSDQLLVVRYGRL